MNASTRSSLLALGFYALGLGAGLGPASSARAWPFYVSGAPGAAACINCHVTAGGGSDCNLSSVHPRQPCLNPFGIDARGTSWASAGGRDQDGDGVQSISEYGAGTLPGFHNAADAYCDMEACASSAGSAVSCGASYIRCTASHSGSPTDHYTFSFSCRLGTGPSPSLLDGNWNDRCLDLDECSPNPCGPGRACVETPLGSWSFPGYSCPVTNDCVASTDDCVALATCSDVPGAGNFLCTCPAGYGGNGRASGSGCSNINECAGNPCGVHGTGCTEAPLGAWSPPGYTCTCEAGYGSDGTTCVVENECTAGTDNCHPLAVCADPSAAANDFTCTCPTGYRGSGRGSAGCRDIDECAEKTDNCAAQATCQNTAGAFVCFCNSGYQGNGRTCTNIDECLDPVFSSQCDAKATCVDSVGSWDCVCSEGYRGNGFTCTDINECRERTDDCHRNADCMNRSGSFSCACRTGFEDTGGGTGRQCSDVDECARGLDDCGTNATCGNRSGGFSCACNAGFSGDGRACSDVNECLDPALNDCHVNADCENQLGTYACTCRSGYRGSGLFCADIDECAEGTSGCGRNEVCINQMGAPNTCVCAPGNSRDESGTCQPSCGDGERGRGEACDDGNRENRDGCNERCEVEPGWACFEAAGGGPSLCAETCGDGRVDPGETCDRGAQNSDTEPDACRTNCQRAGCGDGVVDAAEGCDDGADNSDTEPDACRTTCELAYCGDGVIDSGEACDPGDGTEALPADECQRACAAMDAGVTNAEPPDFVGGGGCATTPQRSGWRGRGGWPCLLLLLGAGAHIRRRRTKPGRPPRH